MAYDPEHTDALPFVVNLGGWIRSDSMISALKLRSRKSIALTVGWPRRTQVVAYFVSEDAAHHFLDVLADLLGAERLERVDWRGSSKA